MTEQESARWDHECPPGPEPDDPETRAVELVSVFRNRGPGFNFDEVAWVLESLYLRIQDLRAELALCRRDSAAEWILEDV